MSPPTSRRAPGAPHEMGTRVDSAEDDAADAVVTTRGPWHTTRRETNPPRVPTREHTLPRAAGVATDMRATSAAIRNMLLFSSGRKETIVVSLKRPFREKSEI